MVTSRDAAGNIFLTSENLAFAMPLILLCGSYAYFKYIPLQYGLPVLGAAGLIIFLRSQMQARKATKLQNLDEGMIKELAGDDDDDEKDKLAKAKQQKAKAQVERRLAAEKKKESNGKKKKGKSSKGDDDDNDDDALLATFAKGSRGKQKKR